MEDFKTILCKIYQLENELEDKRQNIYNAGGQNLDLVNEPLFNQAQALRWVLKIRLDEIDIDIM